MLKKLSQKAVYTLRCLMLFLTGYMLVSARSLINTQNIQIHQKKGQPIQIYQKKASKHKDSCKQKKLKYRSEESSVDERLLKKHHLYKHKKGTKHKRSSTHKICEIVSDQSSEDESTLTDKHHCRKRNKSF